jgi:glucose-1-phosphate adenylyltransferase
VKRDETSGVGIVGIDQKDRVTAFLESPRDDEQLAPCRLPTGWLAAHGLAADAGEHLGSMGIYLFRREVLFEVLRSLPLPNDFGKDIFPTCARTHQMTAHLVPGYWEHMDTIGSYHRASLALASDHPPFDFHSPEGIIYTRMRNLPASRVSAAHVAHCLVSDGCIVEPGTRMERCIMGVRSTIGRNVSLEDVIHFGANYYEQEEISRDRRGPGAPPLGVGEGSVLTRVIVDKNCRIGRNVRITNRRQVREDEGANYVIRDGIVVIPNGAVVPDGTEI